MKKITLIIALVAFLSAQMKVSANLGLNLPNLSGEDIQSVKGKIGFNIAIYSDFQLDQTFDLRTGLQYAKVNLDEGKSSTLADHEEDMVKFEFSSLQIPLLLVFKQSEDIKFIAGPALNFITNAKKEAYEEDHSDGVEDFENLKPALSLKFGLEYKFSQSISALIFYDNGLSSFSKDFDLKINQMLFSLGYSF